MLEAQDGKMVPRANQSSASSDAGSVTLTPCTARASTATTQHLFRGCSDARTAAGEMEAFERDAGTYKLAAGGAAVILLATTFLATQS